MIKPWSLVRPSITRLTPSSTLDEILAVLVFVHELPHWFDRKRASVLISERLGVDLCLIEKLAAEVK